MRSVVWVACAACGFTHGAASGFGPDDGPRAIDSAKIDSRPIDARPIDAKPIDAAPPAPTFVQGGSETYFGNGAVHTFPTPLQAGDLVVFGVSWANTNVTVSSVSDSDGNTYQAIGSPIVSPGVGVLAMYYAENVKAGSAQDTITVGVSQNFQTVVIVAGSYRGIATASALDTTASAFGSGTAASSGGANTNHAHDLVIGIGAAQRSMSAGGGQSLRVGPGLDIIEDREVTTTGSYSATATLSQSGGWLIGAAAFEAAN